MSPFRVPSSALSVDADLSLFSGRRFFLDSDFHIAAKGGQKTHQLFSRKPAQPIIHECGDFWLWNTQAPGGFGLPQPAFADNAHDFNSQAHLGRELLGIFDAQVRKNVLRAPGDPGHSLARLFRCLCS